MLLIDDPESTRSGAHSQLSQEINRAKPWSVGGRKFPIVRANLANIAGDFRQVLTTFCAWRGATIFLSILHAMSKSSINRLPDVTFENLPLRGFSSRTR